MDAEFNEEWPGEILHLTRGRALIFEETFETWKTELNLLWTVRQLYAALSMPGEAVPIRLKNARLFLPPKEILPVSPLTPYIRQASHIPECPIDDYYDLLDSARDSLSSEDLVTVVNSVINDRIRGAAITSRLSDRTGQPEIVFSPDDLVTAIWVQFAQSITPQKNIKRCAACGKIMLSYKANAKTCGGRCRTRASRNRNLEDKVSLRGHNHTRAQADSPGRKRKTTP
ncbi:hypothetical protein V3W47_01875 [Deinococcus sp. YIM 134068]|uniref:hypothetical protein n=1 Tax=Deinococcus lichenicola TaxID=3118910 RepID=UPI002F94E90C